ncbi:hypothetical protein OPT61_g9498 [Boeremia exigua]|uniref:Uncharacterized protein n=1 Tax=Boeremia exigua TaxID=749465 RepID=A0ACC2HTT9_9PLEO|nr:hypothetical protein OPT61_g9498 [Boeremia exigua]
MSDPKLYTVGWICAISTEYVAARAFLDEEHGGPHSVAEQDSNTYTLGKIGNHHVVIAVLPAGEYGTVSAARVANDMLYSFPNVRVGLLVGIGGGAPTPKRDIRLGDVVVSAPCNGTGGVLQYDFGKTIQEQKFKTTGYLNQPPVLLRTAVADLRARYEADGHRIPQTINGILKTKPRLRRKYGKPENGDRLYKSSAVHPRESEQACANTCSSADLIVRQARGVDEDNPTIHYGTIASANQLMKDALVRDTLAQDSNVLCFEMEAAGLVNSFPCLVVRGICDYSDTHKNKDWQGYAAMVAAAYAKDLLGRIAPSKIEAEGRLNDVVLGLKSTMDEHISISRKVLEIAQGEAREKLSEQHLRCLQLLYLTESNNDTTYKWYKDSVPDRLAGTCSWVLEHDHFNTWLGHESGVLLITADPGCGKSVLSKFLVGDVLSPLRTTCYFFFKDQVQNKISQALCAILHQLFSANPQLIRHAMHYFHEEGAALVHSTHSLWLIFEKAVQDPAAVPIFVVLDALDECDSAEAERLIQRILAHTLLNESGDGKVSYLLTSRSYDRITEEFEQSLRIFPRIHVSGEDYADSIGQDVKFVIKQRVNELALRKGLSNGLKELLLEEILGMEHRTYLWAHFAFDHLKHHLVFKTERGVRDALGTMPTSVTDAYEKILSKAKNQMMARKTLSIILAARRPLTLSEMNVAMHLTDRTSSHGDLDLEEEEDFKASLRSLCGLFVSVYRGKVYFIHQTAREFLLVDLSDTASTAMDQVWQHSILMSRAQHVLAEICVRYLLLFQLSPHLLKSAVRYADTIRDSEVFVEYAIDYWPLHYADGFHDDSAELVHLATKLSDPASALYSYWARLHFTSPRRLAYEINPGFTTALGVASFFGLYTVVDSLLRGAVDVNAKDGRKQCTPLSWAIEQHHKNVAELLLQSGADANVKGVSFGTTLAASVHWGDKDMVEKLLDKGAEDLEVTGYGTALETAVYHNVSDMVVLLLRSGVGIDKHSRRYNSALRAAAEKGNRHVVALLQASGTCYHQHCKSHGVPAEVIRGRSIRGQLIERVEHDSPLHIRSPSPLHAVNDSTAGASGRTPLFLASMNGHAEIVTALLDGAADPDAADRDNVTPIHAASLNGHTEVVGILIRYNASTTEPSIGGATPLLSASHRGHGGIVDLLLKAGADWSATDFQGRTALDLALRQLHLQVAEKLVAHGALFTFSGMHARSPLHSAVIDGHGEVVEWLLRSQGDYPESIGSEKLLDVTDTFGVTALHYAILYNRPEIAMMLYQAGANCFVTTRGNWTLLHCAVRSGSYEMVRFIVDKVPGWIASQTDDGHTPLHFAAERDDAQMAVFLLDSCSRVLNMSDNQGSTALHVAAAANACTVATLLIARGADCSVADVNGHMPLFTAMENANFELAHVLLANCSDNLGTKDGTITSLPSPAGLTSLQYMYELSRWCKDVHSPSLLHLAARTGDPATYHYIANQTIEHESDEDHPGGNLLCYAASGGSIEILNAVMQDHVDNPPEVVSWTPLYWAARAGKAELLEALVNRGYRSRDIRVPELWGVWTPLAVAVFHGFGDLEYELPASVVAALGVRCVLVGKLHENYLCNGCFHVSAAEHALLGFVGLITARLYTGPGSIA